jgi:hypothetical protein
METSTLFLYRVREDFDWFLGSYFGGLAGYDFNNCILIVLIAVTIDLLVESLLLFKIFLCLEHQVYVFRWLSLNFLFQKISFQNRKLPIIRFLIFSFEKVLILRSYLSNWGKNIRKILNKHIFGRSILGFC